MAAECHSLGTEKTRRNGESEGKKRIKTNLDKDWSVGLIRFYCQDVLASVGFVGSDHFFVCIFWVIARMDKFLGGTCEAAPKGLA